MYQRMGQTPQRHERKRIPITISANRPLAISPGGAGAVDNPFAPGSLGGSKTDGLDEGTKVCDGALERSSEGMEDGTSDCNFEGVSDGRAEGMDGGDVGVREGSEVDRLAEGCPDGQADGAGGDVGTLVGSEVGVAEG